MQLLKWFSLMKDIVMCNNNLRLKSPLTRSTGQQMSKLAEPLNISKVFEYITFGQVVLHYIHQENL